MTDEEIIQFWGEGSLVRWQLDAVLSTVLPEDAKRFLINVGLPRGIDWSIHFDSDAGAMKELEGFPGYYVIGRDMGPDWMCLDARRNGRVVSVGIDPRSRKASEEFVNSNVHLFAEFLVLYQKYRLSVDGLENHDAKSLVAASERRMKERDSLALTCPGSFWGSMIKEMYIGWM